MDILGSTIVAACTLAAAELAAQVWFAKVGRHWIWAPHAKIDHVLEPGVLPDLPPVARQRVNALGERGDPPPDDARAFRVLVVGGSAAECYLVDQPATWPQVVQAALNRPEALANLGAPAAHVGNLGRSLVTCRHRPAAPCVCFRSTQPTVASVTESGSNGGMTTSSRPSRCPSHANFRRSNGPSQVTGSGPPEKVTTSR